tara:strand:+ start:58 stop:567 length:510 start_codon:yes stop_codon:yes gene_type:complete
MEALGINGHWIGIHDADPRAVTLYRRHYSANLSSDNTHGFVGPTEKMVLMTVDCQALWVWHPNTPPEQRGEPEARRARRGNAPTRYTFADQLGILCSVFRNEGPIRSSTLILEAERLAWGRWPGQRLFTYVWDAKVKSANPGYCFKMAGWKSCGRNKDGRLSILEKLPE